MPAVGLLLVFATVALATDAPLFARTAKPASAAFRVTGPLELAIVGRTGDVDVVDDGAAFTVIVDLRRLDTGMKLRDDHMRKNYLEVPRFPRTQLKAERASLTARPGEAMSGKADGDLTLHGVTRRVPFTYRASCTAAEVCDVAARVDIDMNDFGVTVAPYFGMTVERTVAIDVAFQVAHR